MMTDMNAVVEWLESPAGEDWSRRTHTHEDALRDELVTVIEDYSDDDTPSRSRNGSLYTPYCQVMAVIWHNGDGELQWH